MDVGLAAGVDELSAFGELVTVTLMPDVGVKVWKLMGVEVLVFELFEDFGVFELESDGTEKVLAGPEV